MKTDPNNIIKPNFDNTPSAAPNTSSADPDHTTGSDIDRLKELHGKLTALAKKSFKLAREAGEILCRLKNQKNHGEWESYVEQEVGIHPRTASNYMRIWNETSDPQTLEKMLKSETISDLSVRGALAWIQKNVKKKRTPNDKSDKVDKPEDKPSEQSDTQPGGFLSLVDGSLISLKKIDWKEGLISRASLETSLSELSSKAETPEDKKGTARAQRFVTEISASINRCSGKAKPEEATQTAQAALQAVMRLMSNPNSKSQ